MLHSPEDFCGLTAPPKQNAGSSNSLSNEMCLRDLNHHQEKPNGISLACFRLRFSLLYHNKLTPIF